MKINTDRIIDISLPLYEGMITYPGNTSLHITSKQGATSTASEIIIGSHTGTHIDAPRHVLSHGRSIDKLPLAVFIGTCRVLDMTASKPAISKEDIAAKSIQNEERILFKTANSLRGFETFYDDYIFLSGDAAEILSEKKVQLVGIDSLSIKQKGSSDTRPHTLLLRRNIPILEGINLAAAEEGTYQLIALPLRLMGIDGSVARALLYKE